MPRNDPRIRLRDLETSATTTQIVQRYFYRPDSNGFLTIRIYHVIEGEPLPPLPDGSILKELVKSFY